MEGHVLWVYNHISKCLNSSDYNLAVEGRKFCYNSDSSRANVSHGKLKCCQLKPQHASSIIQVQD